ncbi:MAG: hypothetical protein R2911_22930 [Caldilineaceae bacterium]
MHYDAAHVCGLIAGQAWQQPLAEGAHLLTFSTYKSLGGPAAGAVLTNDDRLAARLDQIAHPGLTANFDVAKSAALAVAMLDWKVYGADYARAMVETSQGLAAALIDQGVPVFAAAKGATSSHQFALEAAPFGGGQSLAKLLRRANILTCGIGLPRPAVDNDLNGLRLGTPEIVRWGMQPRHMPTIAEFMAQVLLEKRDPAEVANAVTNFRQQFDSLAFMRP